MQIASPSAACSHISAISKRHAVTGPYQDRIRPRNPTVLVAHEGIREHRVDSEDTECVKRYSTATVMNAAAEPTPQQVQLGATQLDQTSIVAQWHDPAGLSGECESSRAGGCDVGFASRCESGFAGGCEPRFARRCGRYDAVRCGRHPTPAWRSGDLEFAPTHRRCDRTDQRSPSH
jgi:hypothetical protein